MNYFLIGIIGLLGGLIVSKTLFTNGPDDSGLSAETGSLSRDTSEMETVLQEMEFARDELRALLETERSKFAELSAEVTQLTELLETQLETGEPTQQETVRRGNRINQVNYGLDTLVDAGLTTVEAERIIELEAEARESVQELLADPENRDRNTLREAVQAASNQIRSELGDYGYETYLAATGRPTTVPVGSVAPESTGALAGILPGDQITSYAGQRVFDISDIQTATTSGTEGETVVVEILRDEQTITLVMPRGQIGISTRNRR